MLISFAIKLAVGVAADQVLGEPRRWHPLVGFGRWAGWLEARLRLMLAPASAGVLAWILAVLPWLAIAAALRGLHPSAAWAVDISLLYFALGARSLAEHAEAVAQPLAAGDLDSAREHVGRMVSRNTATLSATEVATAATESVLENGNDAIFGTLLWFCLLGGPGALLFRLANTLDAMWGYRTSCYIEFGRSAARIDDALNWIPARLTALTYALLGHTRSALYYWHTQAPLWDSPNAGPVMAAGAGALGVKLGGAAWYHGQLEQRPTLGAGGPADASTLRRAVKLLHTGMLLWLTLISMIVILLEVAAHA